jgi:hypothetical protein
MNEVILECCGQSEPKCNCAIEELAQLLYTEDGRQGNLYKQSGDLISHYEYKAIEKLKERNAITK